MLTMDEKQYRRLADRICEKVNAYQPMQDPNCKCVIIPSHTEAVHIILTEHELFRLHDMIQSVDTEMRTKALIDLF